MPQLTSVARVAGAALLAMALVACSQMPNSGPSANEVAGSAASAEATNAIQVVDVDDSVARQLLKQAPFKLFSDTFGDSMAKETTIGPGDLVEVNIWEAPPATLFGAPMDPRLGPATAHPTTVPEQMVDLDGTIHVPFAGRIKVVGMTTQGVEAEVARLLDKKANHPEVIVRLTRSAASAVTVVGEVATSLHMPLTPGGERLLDAIAAAGGVRQPINKLSIDVTRGHQFQSMPLSLVIKDPKQNVSLHGGDVVSVVFQPYSFTALGATGHNDEIEFEGRGITLAQALARSGGLVDNRSDPQGVFIFRLEREDALAWPRKPVVATTDGRVPVVYRINLKDPGSFFVMQSFTIHNKDVLYVSNAPAAELQKFLNVVFSVAYPLINAANALK